MLTKVKFYLDCEKFLHNIIKPNPVKKGNQT